MNFVKKVLNKIKHLYYFYLIGPFFRHYYLPQKINEIRNKKKIRFLFLLQELSQWKTECLYLAMLNHPRFEPILGITPCVEFSGAENKLIDYCKSKGYQFCLIDKDKTLVQVHPDIVTHQKPYESLFHPKHFLTSNLSIPCVVIPYAMNSIVTNQLIRMEIYSYCWKQYFENESCCNERKAAHQLKGENYVVTGLPVMDELIKPKESFSSPWPNDGRKRIIYAPHHTIGDLHSSWISYSTFLEYGHFMCEMRDKYRDDVFFIFKPHPMLYKKLCMIWGKEKTDEYYQSWRAAENSNVEDGAYIGLFKHSNAMIHDCGSFTVEYMYTQNPVMYLVEKGRNNDNLSSYAREAFDLHYKSRKHEDIEQFIINVIKGIDPLKEKRKSFYERNLIPPHGKSACENIINSILGVEEYSDL